MPKKDKYAFIVGKGDLVNSVITKAKASNLNFVVVGIKGYSEFLFVNRHKHFWFYLGQVSNLLKQLKEHQVTKVVLLGAIRRPSLFSLKLDSLGKKIVKSYVGSGDNSLLSLLIDEFHNYGFEIVGAHEIDPSILAKNKLYVTSTNYKDYHKDIVDGFNFAKKISIFDIGQSLIYQQGMVIALEAVEGTKEMILRSKKLLKKEGPKGLLIKVKKINQTAKVDLPTIGPKTVKEAKKVGLAGIVIEAANTIILKEAETLALAKKNNIFILGMQYVK